MHGALHGIEGEQYTLILALVLLFHMHGHMVTLHERLNYGLFTICQLGQFIRFDRRRGTYEFQEEEGDAHSHRQTHH